MIALTEEMLLDYIKSNAVMTVQRCYSCINCIFRFFYWMKKVECLAPDISIQVNLLNVERDVSFLIILSKSPSSEIK